MNATASTSDNSNLGPFALSGPVAKPDAHRVPLRGDLAHVALAGRYFVPHYVVPMQRMVGDMGANMRAEATDESEIVYDLSPGQRFDLLDSNATWAWGCLGPDGPVGYVKTSELLDPFA
ncbi:hypothetical protein SZ64_17155 [Erythrobacter sp. SG61-1L]|nr:hypothetical protein SZ64_17155 [Erythrobacter sp. SG61-1L]